MIDFLINVACFLAGIFLGTKLWSALTLESLSDELVACIERATKTHPLRKEIRAVCVARPFWKFDRKVKLFAKPERRWHGI